MFTQVAAPTAVRAEWLGSAGTLPDRVKEIPLSRGVSVLHALVWRAVSVLEQNHALPLLAEPEPTRRNFARPYWYEWALCDGADEEMFFSEDRVLRVGLARKARSFCRACPVAPDCLTHALGGGEQQVREEFGIWAGTSRRQRQEVFERLDEGQTTIEEEVDGWMTQFMPGTV